MTYERALQITKETDTFYVKYDEVEGQEVAIFDYRFANYGVFERYDAFKLRGLTFVKWEYDWLVDSLLPKFFNVNETATTMYDSIKDKKISHIGPKEDGSLISFVYFANDRIRAKSKTSFNSDQAKMAQEIIENDEVLYESIRKDLIHGLTPIFELVGPDNKIVLDHYQKNELIPLMRVRTCDGYIEMHDTKSCSYTIEELLKMQSEVKDQEGWVATFEDGQMVKFKTDWYFRQHKLIGPDAWAENNLVESIVAKEIDDMISTLKVESDQRSKLIEIVENVETFMNTMIRSVKEQKDIVFQENRKEYALQNKHKYWFHIAMTCFSRNNWSEENIEGMVKDYVLKRCRKQELAKSFLDEVKILSKI